MWRAAAHNTAGKQVTAPSAWADTGTLAGKDTAATMMPRPAPLGVVAPAAAAAVAVVAAAVVEVAVEVEAVGVLVVGAAAVAAVEEAGAAAAVGNAGRSLVSASLSWCAGRGARRDRECCSEPQRRSSQLRRSRRARIRRSRRPSFLNVR